jgi:agmatine/peptidylarginine deiminase
MSPRLTGSVAAFALVVQFASFAQDAPSPWDDLAQGPLPRWREGGSPPDDPSQALVPLCVRAGPAVAPELPPQMGLIASPPEYSPAEGVLFRYSTGSWPSVVTACVAALTGDPTHDEKAYVVVSSQSVASSAATTFQNAGADLSKVVFVIEPTDSIWLRDYGPHFLWQSNALAIADSHYYPSRPSDNFIPTLVAAAPFVVPAYPMGLYYSGGNFQPGPNRSGFVTSLVNTDNPEMTSQEIADLYHDYQGIDTLHVMPRLPTTVDGTGHVDMWMYLVDEDSAIISQFKPGSNATAIQITDNAVPYMQALGFTVQRTPAWNSAGTHYTYTNAFRVNDRIFVPIYGPGNSAYLADDQAALAAWTASAGPGVEIVPIDCYSIIPAAGAIHCIVMQVPRVTATTPAVHVIAPCGGEVIPVKSWYDVRWAASDDQAVTAVDLYYSLDGGVTFPYTIATNQPDDGLFAWKLPLLGSTEARVKAVAHDAQGNQAAATSDASFYSIRARTRTYDFSFNAGVDRWAWGYQTASWSALDGVRHPVGTEISALQSGAYAKLATSNATGGDTDSNRYVAPVPSSGSETTHVFEFTLQEPPSCIQEITIRWEGYGDQCIQTELYVWDDVAHNWCDARGAFGLNRYSDNFAGNRDQVLEAHVTSDFDRYVDANWQITFLVYGERSGQESFHDYVSVRTTRFICP